MKKIMIIIVLALVLILGSFSILIGPSREAAEKQIETDQGTRATYIVEPTGMAGFLTIQMALQGAGPYDIIRIWAGTYNENVQLDMPITIIGNSSTNTTINGDLTTDVITMNGMHCKISGVQIKGGKPTWGAGIAVIGDECRIENCNLSSNYYGSVIHSFSNDSKVANCTFWGNTHQDVHLSNTNNHTIQNNTMLYPNRWGISLYKSMKNTIIENNISYKMDAGIGISDGCNDNDIDYNKCYYGNTDGIYMTNCEHNRLNHNTLFHNNIGFFLQGVNFTTFGDNNASHSNTDGVWMNNSYNNTFTNLSSWYCEEGIKYICNCNGNRITGMTAGEIQCSGIYIIESSDTIIEESTFINCANGIEMRNVTNTVVINNTLQNCGIPIREGSRWNDVYNNKLFNGVIFFPPGGNDKELYTTNEVTTNNTINGNPVYKFNTGHFDNYTVPKDAGMVIAGDVKYLHIEGLDAATCVGGICIGFSEHVSIYNNTLTGVLAPMLGKKMNNSLVYNNTFVDSPMFGVYLMDCNVNTLTGNNFINSTYYGLHIVGSNSNEIHHNYFIENNGNIDQVDVDTITNQWDDGEEGNYYSDHLGPDVLAPIGIVDTPYDLSEGVSAVDNFPLAPFIMGPENLTVYEDTEYVEDCRFKNAYNTGSWTFDTNADWLTVRPDATFNGTAGNDDVGTYFMNCTVSDQYVSKNLNFTFEVLDVNDAPNIVDTSMPNATEDEDYYHIFSGHDIDTTGDTLTWEALTNAPFLTMNETTGNISGTPDNSEVGSYWVNLSVLDGRGGCNMKNFTLEVENANDPPEDVQILRPLLENRVVIINKSITFLAQDTGDPDLIHGDVLTFTWDFGDNTTAAGRNVSHTYTVGGIYDVILTVRDVVGATKEDNITVFVVGDEPEIPDYIEVTPPTTVDLGDDVEMTIIGGGVRNGKNLSVTVVSDFSDKGMDEANLTVENGFIGVFVEITMEGTFDWMNITIRYETIPEGINESDMRLFYWDGTDWVEAENSGIDTVNKIIYANVTHLTIFAPMETKGSTSSDDDILPDDDVQDDDDDDDTGGFNMVNIIYIGLLVVGVIIVVVVVFLVLKMKKPEEAEEE